MLGGNAGKHSNLPDCCTLQAGAVFPIGKINSQKESQSRSTGASRHVDELE